MVPGVMTAKALTPQVKVRLKMRTILTPLNQAKASAMQSRVVGLRKLSATMKQPHDKMMLDRSECWYLYHRMSPVDSAQYVSKAPLPTSPDDPNWEYYSKHLLELIGTEISKGIFNRSSEFLMTIATINPPLANQLIPKVLSEAGIFDRDDMAAALVQGGALDVPSLLVHPALPNLSPTLRAALANELLSGWKTDEELALANYLSTIPLDRDQVIWLPSKIFETPLDP